VYAVLGQSIIVVNLGSGVLNFAAGAIGMFGAYVYYLLRSSDGVPDILAFLVAVIASGAIGVAMHVFFMRPLASAPATSRIVATLALLTVLLQAVNMTWAVGGGTTEVTSPLPNTLIHFGSQISVGEESFSLLGIGILLTIALVLAQRRTRIGLAMSAVAENRVIAASMGLSPNVIGAVAWAVGSILATAACIAVASLSGLETQGLAFLVVPAMAAALLGAFNSFPLAFAGGLAIGIAEAEVSRYVTSPGWGVAAPLFAIVIILVVRGHSLPGRAEEGERRPSVGSGRISRLTIGAAAVALVLIVFAPTTWLDSIVTTLLLGIVLLSVLVVTGYAGQLSLAQFSIAGFSAFITAVLAIHAGLPLLAACVLAIILTMPLSIAVAVPALRARGSNLAIATLSLAVALDSLIISNPDRIDTLDGQNLGSLKVFGLSFNPIIHPLTFTLLSLFAFVVCGLMVANLRRGRSGRRLLAVRSNERAAAALGISVSGVKLYAFWLGGVFAAIAGVLIEVRFAAADFSSFQVLDNINAVLESIVGGIGWLAGPLIGSVGAPGGLLSRFISIFTADAGDWLLLAGGIGAFLIVLQSPDGVAPLMLRQARTVQSTALGVIRRVSGRQPAPKAAVPFETPRDLDGPHLAKLARVPQRSLEIQGLTVRFGTQAALRDVSMTVASGEIVGLIGPNGAGKSTLIDVVTGFQPPNAGTVLLDGKSINSMTAARRSRAGISRSFQSLELFEDMTVLENLRTAADHSSVATYVGDLVWPRTPQLTDATGAAIYDFRLDTVLDRLPKELDYGKRRLVAIARALSAAPSLVLLDEPAAGLDEGERRELTSLIRRVSSEWGIGVLLVEHDVQMVFSVCERVVVLDSGQVIADGSVEDVRYDPAVIKAYLGGSEDEPQVTRVES
jgi:sulfate-transporting ATPase